MNPGIRENASKFKSTFMGLAASRSASWLLLGAFFWIVASAGFSGFIGKWGLSGTAEHPAAEERFGLPIMLDGTGLAQLGYPLGMMALMSAVFLGLGAVLFKWRQD